MSESRINMRLILTVVILKHVILSNIQLILVTVGTLESESLSDSLEQSTDRTRCCLLLWPIWGIRKNKIESDLVWSSFSIHYEITWLCWYQMAQPEICIDVTVMRKKDLSAADFSQNLKKWFSWLVNANYLTKMFGLFGGPCLSWDIIGLWE